MTGFFHWHADHLFLQVRVQPRSSCNQITGLLNDGLKINNPLERKCLKIIRRLICLVILAPVTVNGAQYQQFGEVTVFYNSIKSTLIPEQVAVVHGIVRAENRAVINIAIKKNDNPAAARVTGFSTNLISQTNELVFIEVREQSAIYYLASSVVGKNEILRFTINIEIEDHNEPILLNFEQGYY
ncbi:MAG: DUF4426 domain-containing protein [Gammaproteobacteria bacterium]|nr:DUF4426 domain-containing protein [Gammaproteobacteria bacterium]